MSKAIIGYRPCDLVELPKAEVDMTSSTDISVLYREFTDALTEVFAENANGPTRRGHLARTRAAVKKHPKYNEHEYFLAVETAFERWEAMQNAGHLDFTSQSKMTA
jgi:hypothetical protein